jgi:hypothetical protein
MSANSEIAFMAEPGIEDGFDTVLRRLVAELDGFVFAQPNKYFRKSNGHHFLDKDFKLILDTDGNCEVHALEVNVDAKYHDQPTAGYSDEQTARKAKSESFLEANGIKTNKNLPCIEAASEVEIRREKAVVDRAYALLVIAAKGEGVEQDRLQKGIEEKRINSFTPREQAVLDSPTLSDRERAYATWRYESLYTLLWALGKFGELKYPSDICDVEAVVGDIFLPSREAFEASVKLRSKAEILDELDKTYRMNWACVDARISGREVSGGIHPSIIFERHYALNWLTNYQNQDWDNVQTNT